MHLGSRTRRQPLVNTFLPQTESSGVSFRVVDLKELRSSSTPVSEHEFTSAKTRQQVFTWDYGQTSDVSRDTRAAPLGRGFAWSTNRAPGAFSEDIQGEQPKSVGHECRCPECRLSIRTIATDAPFECPFCRTRLDSKEYNPSSSSTSEHHAVKTHGEPPEIYHKAGRLATLLFMELTMICLTTSAFLKFHNVTFFWYQPMVNIYSLSVGIFIVSRFLLAMFYHAPRNVGYEPSITVCIACRNEEGAIEKTIERIYTGGYPSSKLEVVVVNDGSTDATMEEMTRAQMRHPSLVVVDFERGLGKRHGMAVCALLAKNEILVFVDSDSFVFPGALRKIVQGLADPGVGAVSGHTDVENAGTNVLTKMQDVRYFVSYRVMKAAEHLFGTVSCCPGCFSAYRKSYVLKALDKWLHQKFLGKTCTYGDDRSLTNEILRDYRVLYDDEALATTIVPEKWGKYTRQQVRWKRSWIREFFFAGRFFWKKHPVAAISWYAMTLLPLIAPLVMFAALVWLPITTGQPVTFYIGGVLVVTLLWALFYWERTGRRHWWTAFAFTISYILFFSWQGYYAIATLRRTTWGTR